MPSPKSGSAGSAIAPAAPPAALDADVADPGDVAEAKAEQLERQEGKYGSKKSKPYKPPEQEDAEEEEIETTWIEIEMVDESDKPVPGVRYEVTLPDGSVERGTLDSKGYARVDGFEPGGSCEIKFPELDKDAWEYIEAAGERPPQQG